MERSIETVLEVVSTELKRLREAMVAEPEEARRRALLLECDRLIKAKGALVSEPPPIGSSEESLIRAEERRKCGPIWRADERRKVLASVRRILGNVAYMRLKRACDGRDDSAAAPAIQQSP